MSWCVCSCLMQINKCSLCTTIVPAVATVAAIAMLTIIFPGGQCGVCKMRPCYMFLVSMCSCLNCWLARPNLPVSMFTPRLSIILGHRTQHHSHQASPGSTRMQASGSLQHYFKLSRQPKWHKYFCSFDWFSIYINCLLKRSNREQYFPCSNSTCSLHDSVWHYTSLRRESWKRKDVL